MITTLLFDMKLQDGTPSIYFSKEKKIIPTIIKLIKIMKALGYKGDKLCGLEKYQHFYLFLKFLKGWWVGDLNKAWEIFFRKKSLTCLGSLEKIHIDERDTCGLCL